MKWKQESKIHGTNSNITRKNRDEIFRGSCFAAQMHGRKGTHSTYYRYNPSGNDREGNTRWCHKPFVSQRQGEGDVTIQSQNEKVGYRRVKKCPLDCLSHKPNLLATRKPFQARVKRRDVGEPNKKIGDCKRQDKPIGFLLELVFCCYQEDYQGISSNCYGGNEPRKVPKPRLRFSHGSAILKYQPKTELIHFESLNYKCTSNRPLSRCNYSCALCIF